MKADTSALKVLLLGEPEIHVNDQRVDHTLLTKAQALFFYLVLNPQPHARESLTGLLWPDMPDTNARANLRTTLNRLRKTMGPWVEANRRIVRFQHQNGFSIDVTVLENSVTDGGRKSLEAAAAIYRGDFLTGFYIPKAPMYDEWMIVERERLRLRAVEGLEKLTEYLQVEGNLSSAVAYNRRLLALDPYRESSYRNMMRMLVTTGDRTGALKLYKECEAFLNAELGIAPAPATTSLYDKIMRGEIEIPNSRTGGGSHQIAGSRHNIPAPTTSFHGREKELSDLRTSLGRKDCRLLSVVGIGGVGKTRLALEYARREIASGKVFQNGIFFVSLAGVEETTGLLTGIGRALDFEFEGRKPLLEQLGSFLRHKQTLLVLDNMEQLAGAAETVGELLRNTPGLKMLITSREPLLLYEEWIYELEGLAFPEEESGRKGLDTDAARLFVDRAMQVKAQFDPQREADAIGQLCRLVEGLPLGVELAASWVRIYTPDEIRAAIEDNLKNLESRVHNLSPRHRSLAATFEYSWQLLSAEEKEALKALSVFPADFSNEAARAVTGSPANVLDSLVQKVLLRRSSEGRNGLHKQLLVFSKEKCSAELQASLRQRHLDYYQRYLQNLGGNPYQRGQKEILAAIRAELPNFLAAWQEALTRQAEERVFVMIVPLCQYFIISNLQVEGRRIIEMALKRLDQKGAKFSDRTRARLLIQHGRLRGFSGEEARSAKYLLETGLALAQRLEMDTDLVHAEFGLGSLALVGGELSQARKRLETAQNGAHQNGMPWLEADALAFLGWIKAHDDQAEAGKADCVRALAIQREIQNESGIASTLNTYGIVLSQLGDHAGAETAYSESLQWARQNRHLVGASQALTGLFGACYRQGRINEARKYARESLEVNKDAGNVLGIGIAEHNLGFLALKDGQHEEAIVHFMKALNTYETAWTDPARKHNTRRYLAECYLALGDHAAAASTLIQLLTEFNPGASQKLWQEILTTSQEWFASTKQVAWTRRLDALLNDLSNNEQSEKGDQGIQNERKAFMKELMAAMKAFI